LWAILALSVFLAWWDNHRRLQQRIYDIQNPGPGWDTKEATGPPNTPGSGDIPTAWASRPLDGQVEWLRLDYDKSVVPAAVVIHETYNPGAVYKVSAFRWDCS
jgi:hypothetical protein